MILSTGRFNLLTSLSCASDDSPEVIHHECILPGIGQNVLLFDRDFPRP
jgi:hypothetical protein